MLQITKSQITQHLDFLKPIQNFLRLTCQPNVEHDSSQSKWEARDVYTKLVPLHMEKSQTLIYRQKAPIAM